MNKPTEVSKTIEYQFTKTLWIEITIVDDEVTKYAVHKGGYPTTMLDPKEAKELFNALKYFLSE